MINVYKSPISKEKYANLFLDKIPEGAKNVCLLCTDKDQFSYYLVYKNHRIKAVCAIDELNGLMSGVWD